MTSELLRGLGDVELLRRYERGEARVEPELYRRLLHQGGWLASGYAIYLAREDNRIERVPLDRWREANHGRARRAI
jgi:hypothetical protein